MLRFKSLFFVVVLGVLMATSQVFATGSVTQTRTDSSYYVEKWTLSWIGDSSDGSVPATVSTWDVDGYIFMVITDPGAGPPDDAYDITLTDSTGIDIMGGALADRSQTDAEEAVPALGTRYVHGKLTLTISNQTTGSAAGIVYIYIYKEHR